MASSVSLIAAVLLHYSPGWKPPRDDGREWIPCLCPFHDESRPSASVSYRNDALKCHSCQEKGGAIGIIMRKEGLTYQSAIKFAEDVFEGCDVQVLQPTTRKPRRRVFGESGTDGVGKAKGREVPPGVRRRPSAWT